MKLAGLVFVLTLFASVAQAATLTPDAKTGFGQLFTQAKANNVPVEIGLRNGQTFRGKVHSMDSSRLVLTELAGREYFSVTVLIPEIVSVEYRTRE